MDEPGVLSMRLDAWSPSKLVTILWTLVRSSSRSRAPKAGVELFDFLVSLSFFLSSLALRSSANLARLDSISALLRSDMVTCSRCKYGERQRSGRPKW